MRLPGPAYYLLDRPVVLQGWYLPKRLLRGQFRGPTPRRPTSEGFGGAQESEFLGSLSGILKQMI